MHSLPVTRAASVRREAADRAQFEVQVPRYRADYWIRELVSFGERTGVELQVDDQPRADWTRRILTVRARGGSADLDRLGDWLVWAYANLKFGIRTLEPPRRIDRSPGRASLP